MLNQHPDRWRLLLFVAVVSPLSWPAVSVFAQPEENLNLEPGIAAFLVDFDDFLLGIELLQKFLGCRRPDANVLQGIGLATRSRPGSAACLISSNQSKESNRNGS